MKPDLKNRLLLFSFMLCLIDNAESIHRVNGTLEEDLTVEFRFQDIITDSSVKSTLYINDNKKQSCTQAQDFCAERFLLSDVKNNIITLHITNLTWEDSGVYHVVLPAYGQNPIFMSSKIDIKVKLRDNKTEAVPTAEHGSTETNPPKTESSEQKSFLIIFTASVIIFLCLFVGILCWFHRTYPRKPDSPPVQNNNTTQQGQCGRSGAVFVSCVEYGELDFQNRPERDDRVKPAEATSEAQDGVEYAAIIFPQQKPTPCGRMRNKQQVPAIK